MDLPARILTLVQRRPGGSGSGPGEQSLRQHNPVALPGPQSGSSDVPQSIARQLRKHNLRGLAGRNTARLALAANVPASILAEITGPSVSNATRWATLAKRDWTGYISSQRSDG
ncbi:hypothetical protein [Streptomyces sp. NPDC002403]